jgi:hypothetical protein
MYRTLATHITKKAGYNKQTAQTGTVKLIQRFEQSKTGEGQDARSHFNIHFHETHPYASPPCGTRWLCK